MKTTNIDGDDDENELFLRLLLTLCQYTRRSACLTAFTATKEKKV